MNGTAHPNKGSSRRRRAQRYAAALPPVDSLSCPAPSGTAHSLCMPQLGCSCSTLPGPRLMMGCRRRPPSRDRSTTTTTCVQVEPQQRQTVSGRQNGSSRPVASSRGRQAPWITRRRGRGLRLLPALLGPAAAARRLYFKKRAGNDEVGSDGFRRRTPWARSVGARAARHWPS